MKVMKVWSGENLVGKLKFDEESRKWSFDLTNPPEGHDGLEDLLMDPVADGNLENKCTANSDPEKFMEYAPITYRGISLTCDFVEDE